MLTRKALVKIPNVIFDPFVDISLFSVGQRVNSAKFALKLVLYPVDNYDFDQLSGAHYRLIYP